MANICSPSVCSSHLPLSCLPPLWSPRFFPCSVKLTIPYKPPLLDSLEPQVFMGFSYITICLQCRGPWFSPWVGKIPWRRERLPTPVFWPAFHGLYSSWGHKELDTTEWLSLSQFHIYNKLNLLICLTSIYLLDQLKNLDMFSASWEEKASNAVLTHRSCLTGINWVDKRGFPRGSAVKTPPTNAGDAGDKMATHSRILAWKVHGQRSLEGYRPRGCQKSDMTEHAWMNKWMV